MLTDLMEVYIERLKEKGRLRAGLWYLVQLFKIGKGRLINACYWRLLMLLNHLKFGLRSMMNHKGFTSINIAGLAVGIACCILLLSYVNYELSYDTYHEHADRIFRIVAEGNLSDEAYTNAKVPAALTPMLESDYPEIERTVRFATEIFNMFRHKDKKFYESDFYYADAAVFDVFSFSLIQGDPETALSAPNTVVLTRETVPVTGETI